MRIWQELGDELNRIDGKGYKAYKDIAGTYRDRSMDLMVDYVQGDPFAAPSRLRVRIPADRAELPEELWGSRSRRIALEDYLIRAFDGACRRMNQGSGGEPADRGDRGYRGRGGDPGFRGRGGRRGDRGGQGNPRSGSGKSGLLEIDRPGQEILERSACRIHDSGDVELRFQAGLPAFGRKIAGRLAAKLLLDNLPRAAEAVLFKNLNPQHVLAHVETAENADDLRQQLAGEELIAFVADGAILPRRSGVDQRPLEEKKAVPFASPESLRRTFALANGGEVTGMGIPRGITLVVGGGSHGQSTLLTAVERGIYNHKPGDGREQVVTDPEALKIRAEDGRRVEKVTITPFISHLPAGPGGAKDTERFSTEDASGSTSQAANIVEGLEAGASALLIDEDTSATNFMIRDHRMQELIAGEKEPITPFIDKVKSLFRDRGVSTILVIGGSGDYFDVADHVIAMEEYRPRDVTEEARAIAEKYRSERKPEGGESFGELLPRRPLKSGVDPSKGKKPVKVSVRGAHTIQFGTENIDAHGVEQLVDASQTRGIAEALVQLRSRMDGRRTLEEILEEAGNRLEKEGLDGLSSRREGGLAHFRTLELAAVLNRLRTLKMD